MEENNKNWFKHSDALIAAFAVPIIIMIIIFIQREIYPFGDRSFLRNDLYHQYAPFFSEFQSKLLNGGSLFHTWDVGLGINFTSIYAYYLASPLNWFVAFVPKQYILEFITYMVVLKTGLAGLTMTIYLNKHAKNTKFVTALFGILYALSGYMMAYSWNIMWIDCIVLFPLICLGLEKLVSEKRGLLYLITLALCIASNYYISIMICAFLVIYFIMILIVNGKTSFKSFIASVGMFALYSLLAGALSAAMLIPTALTLQATSAGTSTFPQTVTQYFSIIDVLARHMPNVETEQVLDHWPNIYCGVGIYALGIMYFLNKKIPLKEKVVYGFVALFMIASFSINVLNYIWHGMHYPNSLPCRQSFIYIFLILYMCFRTVENLDGNNLKSIAISAVASISFVLLCQKVVTDDAFKWSTFYIALGFLIVYLILIYIYRDGKINVNLLIFLLLAIVSVEAAINATTTGVSTTSRSAYIKEDQDVANVVDYVKDEPGFFRFDKLKQKSKDDGAWYNMKTASVFSSTASRNVTELYRSFGCEASVNAYSTTGSTPLVDALLDIKYAISTGENLVDTDYLKTVSGDIHLYEHKYCLPVGYMVDKDVEDYILLEDQQPVLVQNAVAGYCGAPDVLQKIDGFNDGNLYTATIPQTGLYYAYSNDASIDEIEVTIGDETKKFDNLSRGFFMDLGTLEQNTIIYFKAEKDAFTDVSVYRFDFDSLDMIASYLGSQGLEVTEYDDSHISGKINVTKEGTLLTTIPYDNGWQVMIDGRNGAIRGMFGDALMGIDLSAGEHTIALTYTPQMFEQGRQISTGVAALILLLIIVRIILDIRKKIKKKQGPEDAESEGGPNDDNPVSPEGHNDEDDDSDEEYNQDRENAKPDYEDDGSGYEGNGSDYEDSEPYRENGDIIIDSSEYAEDSPSVGSSEYELDDGYSNGYAGEMYDMDEESEDYEIELQSIPAKKEDTVADEDQEMGYYYNSDTADSGSDSDDTAESDDEGDAASEEGSEEDNTDDGSGKRIGFFGRGKSRGRRSK